MPARLPLRYAALAALSVLLATSLLAGCGAQGVTSPRADSATPTSQANQSTALPTPEGIPRSDECSHHHR